MGGKSLGRRLSLSMTRDGEGRGMSVRRHGWNEEQAYVCIDSDSTRDVDNSPAPVLCQSSPRAPLLTGLDLDYTALKLQYALDYGELVL